MSKIMKGALGLFLFLIPVSVFSQTDTWAQRDSIKGPPKSACVAFTAYTSGFVGGGFDLFEYKRSFYRYDPAVDDWDQLSSLGDTTGSGLERSSAVAFSINNMGYVGLGQGLNPFFDDFWQYDPATDSWTQVADFGGTARTMAVGFAIDTAGYVGTGADANGFKNDFWRYSPATNTWYPIAAFPGSPRRLAVGIAVGNVGYVGTGDDGTFKKDFWKYTPTTNNWSPIADFGGTARYGATGFSRYPSLFVGTGYDNTLNYKNDLWEFNFWSGTWISRASFPSTPRSNAIGFTIGQSGFIGGGFDGDPKDDFYEYFIPLSTNFNEPGTTEFTLFPNPANQQVEIKTTSEFEIQQVSIYNVQGKRVISMAVSANHQSSVVIPVYTFETGMYICEVTDKNGMVYCQKFDVAR
ncbi:MAG: kelch repeat-containing protein [Flavobacteriales bacterium]